MGDYYYGWLRPGPDPPGGVEVEPGETLDYISGRWRIFQYESGHRFSTDDVLTAWYGTTCAPRVARAADLGSGIGSVALIVAWRLPAAQICTVEAQSISVRLARKSVRYNGVESRFTIYEGDLRDPAVLRDEPPFDLVTGSPPYFPPGTAVEAEHPQAVPARIELRGDISGYAEAAARILAPGGLFAFVYPAAQRERAEEVLDAVGLALVRCRDVIFREGDEPRIALFAAMRRDDVPPLRTFIEQPLTIRRADGTVDPEYASIRMSFGFPPGIGARPSGPQ